VSIDIELCDDPLRFLPREGNIYLDRFLAAAPDKTQSTGRIRAGDRVVRAGESELRWLADGEEVPEDEECLAGRIISAFGTTDGHGDLFAETRAERFHRAAKNSLLYSLQ